jgi:hypothetical protein
MGLFTLIIGMPAHAQYQRRHIQIDDKVSHLNGGRTFYMVIKKTTATAFLTDGYNEISELISAEKKNKDVLVSEIIWPGRTRSIVFEAPDDTLVGIYLLLTNPGGDWKTLLTAPLRHHYTLQIRGNQMRGIPDPNQPVAVQLAVQPRPYPTRIVDRPLILYPEMLQGELVTRIIDQPAALAALEASFGVMSTLEAGVIVSVGRGDGDGFNLGRSVTPRIRFLLSESTALEALVPISFDPVGVGLTLGLPTRIKLGPNTQLEVARNLATFRLYNRVMSPYWADKPDLPEAELTFVDTATAEFRFLGTLRQQIKNAAYVTVTTGLEVNAYRFSASDVPVDAVVGLVTQSQFDLELGGGIHSIIAERPTYHLTLGVRGRFGGN